MSRLPLMKVIDRTRNSYYYWCSEHPDQFYHGFFTEYPGNKFKLIELLAHCSEHLGDNES